MTQTLSPRLAATLYRAIVLVAVISTALLVWDRLWDMPEREYAHRLVSYEFGPIRRALIGALYHLVAQKVSVLAVTIEGLLTVAIAAVLGAVLFRRLFPVASLERLALACFVFGSPFLFKNFVGNNAKFDVIGAMVLLLTALLPMRRWALGLLVALSVVLLMLHHVNATLFVPAIAAVTVLRRTAAGEPPVHVLAETAAGLAFLAVVTLYIASRALPIGPEAFQAMMERRATVPLRPDLHQMWFMTMPEEIAWTWRLAPMLLARAPIYLPLIALHWPVIAFARRRLREAAAGHPLAGWLFLGSALTVTAAYAVTAVLIFDHARMVSDLGFCLAVLAAVQWLALKGPITDLQEFPARAPVTVAMAFVVAAVPWVGTVTPLF